MRMIAIVGIISSVLISAVRAENVKHVVVYKEPGRFGGWPANHGAWIWGEEILVGFSRGYYKDLGHRHHIDREKPEEHALARSLDGGNTWTIEHPNEKNMLLPQGKALHGVELPDHPPIPATDCPGGIDFTHPDFAMTLRMSDIDTGESRFYVSTDRGKTWEGPYRLPDFGTKGVMARTDYIVDGEHECMVFLTAAKSSNEEGRPFVARTTDGAKTWKFVSFIGPEPEGFSIMPSSVRLSEEEIIVAVRRRNGPKRWNEVFVSSDNGESWEYLSAPAPDLGEGNPPSMIRLQDGRVCITYGVRKAPFSICARMSEDGGKTWGEEIVLRDGGGGRDIGYPRTLQRPDRKVVTLYYFCDGEKEERYIAATIWDPSEFK